MDLRGKKILFTGCAGFIGNNLGPKLVQLNPQSIIGIDKMGYMSNDTFYKKENIEIIKEDISNPRINQIVIDYCPDIIINMAAESHVDNSIKNPMAFLKSNVEGTLNLLNCSLKMSRFPLFVQISCYDTCTRALTIDGYKSYDKIKDGDLVLTINPETSIIEWKPVEKVIIQDYVGSMINFKSKSVDMCVTPNHRMIIRDKDKKLRWYTAEDQSKRYNGSLPIGSISDFNDSSCSSTELDLLFLIGVYLGDGHTYHSVKKIRNKSGLCRKDYIKNRNAKGHFISGKIGTEKETIMNSYRTFFEVPENDKCRNRLEEALNRLNIKYSKYKKNIYVGGKKWYDLFIKFGTGAFNKHIPSEYLKLSKNRLQSLFDGLMLSDGSLRKTKSISYQYTTVSETLASQVVLIGTQLGWKTTSRISTSSSDCYIKGRQIKSGSAFCLLFTKQYENRINKYITKIENYNGKIWCLKVKDNKNFLIERNGKFSFCGNTDEIYGDVETGTSIETDSRKSSSPYSASKAAAEHFVEAYYRTYGVPYVITRSSNNYGPFQDVEKFIPKVIVNLLNNKKVPIYGNGSQERDWIHVSDNCDGIIAAIQQATSNSELVFNIGIGNQSITNKEIVEKVCYLLDKDFNTNVEYVTDRPGHDVRYSLSSSLLQDMSGWKPKISLDLGLCKTVDWYKKCRI